MKCRPTFNNILGFSGRRFSAPADRGRVKKTAAALPRRSAKTEKECRRQEFSEFPLCHVRFVRIAENYNCQKRSVKLFLCTQPALPLTAAGLMPY